MKVREIGYSRLFNLENYNNERIEFRAEIEDGQDENKAMAELFFKVLQIENSFAMYREFLRRVEELDNEIARVKQRLKRDYIELYKIEAERAELDESKDERSKCRIISLEEQYANTLNRIEERKKGLRELVNRRNKALSQLIHVKEAILKGEFAKVGEPQPKDADDIIKDAEASAKLAVQTNYWVDEDLDLF